MSIIIVIEEQTWAYAWASPCQKTALQQVIVKSFRLEPIKWRFQNDTFPGLDSIGKDLPGPTLVYIGHNNVVIREFAEMTSDEAGFAGSVTTCYEYQFGASHPILVS